MAATDLDICNIALGHLGVTQPVTNITTLPTTKEEKQFARLYAHTRKLLLERYRWRFAQQRAVLVAATGVTLALNEWLYAYDLPTNFLAPRKLFAGLTEEATDQAAPFDVIPKDDGTARVLVCNLQPVTNEAPVLIFGMDVTDPTRFPIHFDHALAWALADAVATPLRIDAAIVKDVRARAKYEILEAVADSAVEEKAGPPPEAEHIRARS